MSNEYTLSKISVLIRNQGIGGVFQKIVAKWIYRKSNIVLLELDLAKPQRNFRKSKQWHCREMTLQDLPACQTHFGNYVQVYKDFFAEGFYAYAGFCTETGDVIGIVWYADKDYHDTHYYGCTFPVKKNQVFQYAGEVAAEFRNRHISAETCQVAWSELADRGMKSVYTTVDHTNTPSLRLLFHLGFEEIGETIEMHELLGFKWFRKINYQGLRFEHLKKKRAIAQAA